VAGLTTKNLTPGIGTEIRADRDTLLSGAVAGEIRRLLGERGVLVFPQINLSDQDQLAFSKTLGEILPQGEGGIFKVSLDKNVNPGAEYLKGTFYWHIDGATDDVPTRASLLSARKLSATGGETEFANTYAAYDELPEAERKQIDGLRVIHSLEAAQRMVNPEPAYAELKMWQMRPSKSQPLVWKHQSGRKSLVLGATSSHVEKMELEPGRALLCKLLEWSTQRQFVYQHKWHLGDLVIWDNTGTMHRALPYAFDSGRTMHRTTLVGEEALA
jgi:alpha-ketoglutarate-dependent taurine dioxygenase